MPDWSRAEVEAIVEDYFAMLEAERGGVAFNKAEHRRELATRLNNRSKRSIEWKHMNISAILLKLEVPPVRGYQPLGNYQQLLAEVVEVHLRDRKLVELLIADAARDVAAPSFDDILDAHVAPPKPRPSLAPDYPKRVAERRVRSPDVDYLAIEQANRSLGEKGELFVVRYEQERLSRAGHERLAGKVDRVSRSVGDGLGYDVLSFEENEVERLIEVKTTKYGEYWPFYVTPTEIAVSREREANYQLYRLYSFNEDPKFYTVAGRIDQPCFSLVPTLLRAHIVGQETAD